MSKQIELVRFMKPFHLYNAGEIAGFAPDRARVLYEKRVAVPASETRPAAPAFVLPVEAPIVVVETPAEPKKKKAKKEET